MVTSAAEFSDPSDPPDPADATALAGPRGEAGARYLPRRDGTVVGVGVDVVDIDRLAGSLRRTPALLARLFTPGERSLSDASRAARVAAKEAVGKALGHPGDFSWQDVTVDRTGDGRPYLVLRGATQRCAQSLGVSHMHLSLSHDGGVATAIVVAERSVHEASTENPTWEETS